METSGNAPATESSEPPTIEDIEKRIARRAEAVLANPNATTAQKAYADFFATFTLAYFRLGRPLTIPFAQRLIEISDPFMPPSNPSK